MKSAGFTVVVPETESLEAMLAMLTAARLIVFAEGSAIHNLDLSGHIDARIFVIGRRAGTRHRFGDLLAAAADKWSVFSHNGESVGIDWDDKTNAPHRARVCSFIDLPALVKALARFLEIDLPVPDAETARRAAGLDLLRYLLNPRTGDMNNDELVGRALRAMRKSPSVGALFPNDRR